MKQHLLPTRAAGRVGSDGVQGRITIPSAALVPRIVLKLLYNLNEKNLAYRSINVYRLILSETLDQMAGFDVSKPQELLNCERECQNIQDDWMLEYCCSLWYR